MNNKILVFYDYNPDGSERPVWLAAEINSIPWEQSSFYIDVESIHKRDVYDFNDDIIGCSVFLEELLLSPMEINKVGINLSRLKKRLSNQGINPPMIERFIIQICDIAEILYLGEAVFA